MSVHPINRDEFRTAGHTLAKRVGCLMLGLLPFGVLGGCDPYYTDANYYGPPPARLTIRYYDIGDRFHGHRGGSTFGRMHWDPPHSRDSGHWQGGAHRPRFDSPHHR